jgi:hypothetical protein
MREIFIQQFREGIREIEDFSGYWASNLGRIISAPNRQNGNKWIVLSPCLDSGGYQCVCLHRNGRRHTREVHDLVGRAFNDFSGPGIQWRHFPDSDKLNNRADNLIWGSQLKNGWDWICERENQEDWGISYRPNKSKKNPWQLRMSIILGDGRKNIGLFQTVEAARGERDRLCILHGMKDRIIV